MSNSTAYKTYKTYSIASGTGLLWHFPGIISRVRDGQEEEKYLMLEARIRSGDYIQTLAAEMESIAQQLAGNGIPEAVDLERLSDELLVVDIRYGLQKRRSGF